MLQYSQIKLTCIILLCNNIQYQFCRACECSLTSRGHCSFVLFFCFLVVFFLFLFFSATETSYVNGGKKLTVSMWSWTRGQPFTFYFLDCRSGCLPPSTPPRSVFPSVFNRGFVGGLLDVVWIKILVCGDWPGFLILLFFFVRIPPKQRLYVLFFLSVVSLIASLPPLLKLWLYLSCTVFFFLYIESHNADDEKHLIYLFFCATSNPGLFSDKSRCRRGQRST